MGIDRKEMAEILRASLPVMEKLAIADSEQERAIIYAQMGVFANTLLDVILTIAEEPSKTERINSLVSVDEAITALEKNEVPFAGFSGGGTPQA